MRYSTRTLWVVYALVGLAILVTYARVPLHELYNVSHDGVRGGLSRELVYSNWPLALVVPVLGVLAARRTGTRVALGAAFASVLLCAVVAFPHVVQQSDLDAKPANAIPALGLLIALALELRAPRASATAGRGTIAAWIVIALVSIPWLGALLGFHAGLGVFMAAEQWHGKAAVHLGDHHGFDGALLAASALALRPFAAGTATRAYVALLLAYGVVNALQDFWLEQVVKRGWTTHEIPSAIYPKLGLPWLVILAGAVAAFVAWTPRSRVAERAPVAAR